MAISSIEHKGLRRLYERDGRRGLPPAFVPKLRDMLHALDSAETIDEVGIMPGWRLHPLKGDLKDMWSLTVSGNWRLVFCFRGGNAFDLDPTDYH
jgi:proteic killer suppression protein